MPTDKDVKSIEAKLGVKLPEQYIQALRLQPQQQYPDDLFIYYLPSFGNHSLIPYDASKTMVLCGCKKLEELELLSQSDWSFNSGVSETELLVVLMQDGPRFWCLDYHKCGPQGEPSVTYTDVELNEEAQVAHKFQSEFF